MNKEELEYTLEKIDYKIEELQNLRKKNIEEYIEENAEFKIGEKVFIQSGNVKQIGFVQNRSLSYFDKTIMYDCLKQKKDGTPSLFLVKDCPVVYISTA